MLKNKIEKIDFEQAKQDVFPFVKDSASIALWSKSFFEEVVSQMQAL